MIYSIGRTQEREQKFKWVGEIMKIRVYFYKLKERDDIIIEDLSDAMKYRIGVILDDARADYLKNMGFPDLYSVATDKINLRALFHRRIDLFPIDDIAIVHLTEIENLDISKLEKAFYLDDIPSSLYIAFSLETDDNLVNKCRDALTLMKNDGTIDSIINKYRDME